MDGYTLSRQWFDWCFENPEKITPNHCALYFFIVEQCNRLGWKEKFGLPMEVAKEAIGIKNYRTYKKTFEDLVEWGFIHVHQTAKNQFSATVIAIVKNTKAPTKALSKALSRQVPKQSHSIVGIDKPLNQEPINDKTINISFEEFWNLYDKKNDRKQSEKLWNSLTDEQRSLALNDIPKYKAQLTDIKYQVDPAKYLKNERFKDDRKPRKINGTKVLGEKLFNETWK